MEARTVHSRGDLVFAGRLGYLRVCWNRIHDPTIHASRISSCHSMVDCVSITACRLRFYRSRPSGMSGSREQAQNSRALLLHNSSQAQARLSFKGKEAQALKALEVLQDRWEETTAAMSRDGAAVGPAPTVLFLPSAPENIRQCGGLE